MTECPKVTAIVPCRNEAKFINSFLNNVAQFTSPAGGYEVIIADGMSTDGTREILRDRTAEDLRIRMIDNTEKNTPCGLNVAIRAARGNIIVRLDVHSQYDSDYLVECVACLENSGADNVGGPWIARGEGYIGQTIALAFGAPFAVGGAKGHTADYEGPVDTVYLGCWNKSLFDKIGLFDEEFVRNQDDEMNFRIEQSGGIIWQTPRIKSRYTCRSDFTTLFRQYFQYGYWKVKVIQRHGRPASLRHIIPAMFVSILALLIAGSLLTRWCRLFLFIVTAFYSTALLVSSLAATKLDKIRFLPIMPLTIMIFHISYGLGFIAGLFDRLCFGQFGRFTSLTR